MSTRATIEVKGKDGSSISIYKHHDGYVKNGLGEQLAVYLMHCESTKDNFGSIPRLRPNSFPSRFSAWGIQQFGAMAHLHELEVIDYNDKFGLQLYTKHGDTEYHYTIENGSLFVQVRDYENAEQNGDLHWTYFAEKVELANSDSSPVSIHRTIESITSV